MELTELSGVRERVGEGAKIGFGGRRAARTWSPEVDLLSLSLPFIENLLDEGRFVKYSKLTQSVRAKGRRFFAPFAVPPCLAPLTVRNKRETRHA